MFSRRPYPAINASDPLGTQVRIFLRHSIDDACVALRFIFRRWVCDDFNLLWDINIGNPGEFTMLELADLVLEDHRIEVGARVRGAPGRRPIASASDLRAPGTSSAGSRIALREASPDHQKYFRTRLGL